MFRIYYINFFSRRGLILQWDLCTITLRTSSYILILGGGYDLLETVCFNEEYFSIKTPFRCWLLIL